MKKSIVLLISLLFITAISALILKNLEDTDIYVQEQNSKVNKTQSMMLIKNVQNEISSLLAKNKENVESIIEAQQDSYYPLNIKNIDILFRLGVYDKVNLNDLNNSDKGIKQSTIDRLNDLEVFNIDNLAYLLRANKIESNKQLDNILTSFIKDTYDDKILEVKEFLGFLSNKEGQLYELFIKLDYLKDITNAYYILDKEGQVKYFELSFK
ncbi:hypothetical protein GCM10012288_16910 [Malaciobacter pacificus]|uniref:Uncharacterized protein n=1 Tax=Malaciobacter pacificus TaxID=1080223 RepID=A0A5C2HEW2_9BACT|nr:hypothetical protein [Malaciobacter pacificus]QEP34932.1 hypothetical protein APAC_1853 [Malaciobacter pacificus]GGD43233.1 hypothetical protein GCM10012288_16910 [Malaciobacter pacificus]